MEEEEGTRGKAGKNTAIDYEKLERDIEEQRKIGLQVLYSTARRLTS